MLLAGFMTMNNEYTLPKLGSSLWKIYRMSGSEDEISSSILLKSKLLIDQQIGNQINIQFLHVVVMVPIILHAHLIFILVFSVEPSQ